MKKSIKVAAVLTLFLCASLLNVTCLKAENISQTQYCGDRYFYSSGHVVSLPSCSKSGLMYDNLTGYTFEFQYSGAEKLEVNTECVYIIQITIYGKIIIRDIHRR